MKKELVAKTQWIMGALTVYCMLAGLGFILYPIETAALHNFHLNEPEYGRVNGAAILAMGYFALLAIKSNSWLIFKFADTIIILWLFLYCVAIVLNLILEKNHDIIAYVIQFIIYFLVMLCAIYCYYVNKAHNAG